RPGPWMRPLETANVVAAVATVAVILALFSPVADPARLSVNDQMARLARGDVTAEQFDYAFLRFESGRHGQAALARLAASEDEEVARRAREAQQADSRWAVAERIPEGERRIEAWPEGADLPEGFLDSGPRWDARARCTADAPCLAMTADTNRDGVDEVLVAQSGNIRVFRDQGDGWRQVGNHTLTPCDGRLPDAVAA